MAIQSSSPNDQIIRKNSTRKVKPIHFLAGFILISFIAAFILGGIFIGRNKNNESSNDQIKLSSESIPDSPEKWKTYTLPTINMEIRLPEKLSTKGDWKEQITNGSSGSKLCFSYETQKKGVCDGSIFTIGGSSIDFSEGRGSAYTDYQGFEKEGNKILIKSVFNKKVELKGSKTREITNQNGVNIIKILGENQANGRPVDGTAGQDTLSAIINTNNQKYPGVEIIMNTNSGISEYEFDQILESIKFTK